MMRFEYIKVRTKKNKRGSLIGIGLHGWVRRVGGTWLSV